MTDPIPAPVTSFPATLSPQARRAARIELLGAIEYPADLPVVLRREELAKAIASNQVVIVCGETGSGKTTQLPKICISIGRGVQGAIAHTQPRRVAARTVASRIAQELKTELGGTVGYKIRFNDRVSPDTCIKLMTDGILLAEIQTDPLLKKYDTIIIDEAHERSLNIDFLLGYFVQILPKRRDLKLIITSATLDAERFSKHFATSSLSQRGRAGVGEQAVRHAALPQELLTHARELRKHASDAENLLWQLLRRNQLLGFGFRRQHPLGAYILDFYCHQAKLAIELDGGQHAEDAQHAYDEARSRWLEAQGITVLRYWNNEVLANTQGVLQSIYEKLKTCPLPNPPPEGEGMLASTLEGISAPVIQVSGRSYPVEVRYRPPQQNEEGELQDVPQAVCGALDELSIGGLRGDVLVFLPGEREIRDTAEALRKHHPKGVEILPLFSRLSAAEQDRVFKPTSGMRRVVLATNVAETSLTVPNIGYVIDSGLARINRYSIRQKVEQLRIEKISRAAANQRAGRCGRVMSGICVRLYEEDEFLLRNEFTDAEIFRVSLATVILRMSALRLGEVEDFPFIEAPGSRAISDGFQLLAELGAINETRQLTPLGKELAKFPLDPKIARLLLAGRQYHCLQEILIIASALSLQDPRDRPAERREAADAAHKRFNDESSDFLAYIKLWSWFQEAIKHKKSNRLWAAECRDHFLSAMRLREWHELYQQLHAQVAELGWLGGRGIVENGSPTPALPRGERELVPLSAKVQVATASIPSPSGGGLGRGSAASSTTSTLHASTQPATYEQIHKALLTGLLGNIGCKSVDGHDYLGPREIRFNVAPNSVLAKKGAKWIVAAEIVETTKLYARCVARIEPQWLEEVAAHLIKRHYYDPHWEKKAAQVAAFERSTLFGLLLNPKKRVHYGPMNVEESRQVFIREALVQGEFNTMAPFFAHNQKLIQDIEALEHKSRRPDVLVDDELIYAFYDSRIPPHIHNGAAFEAWRKEAEKETPKLLYLQRDDLMRHEAAGITTDQFPPQLVMNNVSYALGYNFAPGKSDDGVTLTVPLALINQVSAARCEYLVPGLLAEKVAQLLKTLPQKIRRNCVPVPEFAAKFCAEIKPSDTGLLLALAKYIRAQKQLDVPLDAFRLEQLPVHLLMNFVVADEHGRQLGVSRNFAQLRAELAPKQTATPVVVDPGGAQVAEKMRFAEWTLGDFKETTAITRAGQTITLFNALVDDKDAVVMQAFDTREAAQASHRFGLRRLFMLALKEQVKFLEKNLLAGKEYGSNMAMQFLPFGSAQDLQRQIFAVTFDRSCLGDPLPATEKEFAARCKEAKSRLNLVAQEIARLVSTVLQEYQVLQKALPGFKAHGAATQDIKAQCEWLLHKEFIAKTPYERLQHLPRYLKAMNVRLEKLRADPARDARQFAQMQGLQQQWLRKLAAQQGNVDSRVEEFGWLLQELRVSLFAQELKTPVIVSVKRLQKMWEALI